MVAIIKWTSILFIILLPLRLSAQKIKVSGKILDAYTEEALIGAHIISQSDWRLGAVSALDGSFVLAIDLTKGSDSLIVSFIGYKEQVIGVDKQITAGISIYLVPKSTQIQAVEVRGEPLIAAEFSVKKIKRLDIYKNPAAKADVLIAVNTLPSSTTVDETANVSFRGSSPAQTGIFFNQVPVYDAIRFSQLNGIGTFSFFNTDIVNNVQVFASNPPLEFGNTSAGLIAIESENRRVRDRQTTVLISLANTGINHRQRLGKNSGLTVYGNYQFAGPLKALNPESLKDIPDFSSLDAGLHYVYQSPKNIFVKVFNYVMREGYDFNFRSPSFNGIFSQSRFNNLTIANVIRKIKPGSNVSLNMGYRFSNQLFEYSGAEYDIRNQDLYGSAQYHIEKKGWGLKTGVAYDGRFQRFAGNVPVFYYALRPEHPFETIPSTAAKREILDVFQYYKYIPLEKLTLGAALRKNIPLNGTDHYLSYQANLDYQIHPQHNLKMAAGTFHQTLLAESNGDGQLISTLQASLEHQFTAKKLTTTSAIFVKRSAFLAGPEDFIKGIELTMQYQPINRFTATVSYTGLMVDTKLEGLRFPSKYDLPYFFRMSAEWNFIKQYTIGLRGLFRAGTYYPTLAQTTYHADLDAYEPTFAAPQFATRYPAYNILDINFSALFSLGDRAGLVVFLSVGNLFDIKNVRHYSYNADYSRSNEEYFSRRTIYFGVMVTF